MQALQQVDHWFFTRDRSHRLWLSQSALAWLLMGSGVVAMQYVVRLGYVDREVVIWWGSTALGGLALAYLLIRFGLTQHWRDPALTLPQMAFAITCAAVAYGMAGPLRGAVLPTLMVVLLFGLFNLPPRAIGGLSVYALVAFGAVMGWMVWHRPGLYPPGVELVHFLMLAAMLPAVFFHGHRLAGVRGRLVAKQLALDQAAATRQREALRDPSTGLMLHPYMRCLLAHELGRQARLGPVFSLVMMEPDALPAGHAERAFVAMSERIGSALRSSDVLCRWHGDAWALLLPQTDPSEAVRLLERIGRRVRRMSLPADGAAPARRPTLSIGLAGSQVDDGLKDLLERVERALWAARSGGGDRVVYREPG